MITKMRNPPRRYRRGFSSGLFAVVVVSWVLSHWVEHGVLYASGSRGYAAVTVPGQLTLVATDAGENLLKSRFEWDARWHEGDTWFAEVERRSQLQWMVNQFQGFGFYSMTGSDLSFFVVAFPFWLPAGVLAILFALDLSRRWRGEERRATEGGDQ